MKTGAAEAGAATAAIVHLAAGGAAEEGASALARAQELARAVLAGERLDTGEDALAHAEGVAGILQAIGAAPAMRAAAYLVYVGDHLTRAEERIGNEFGPSYASLVALTRKLVRIQRTTRDAQVDVEQHAQQIERVRKMLLAFSRDLRVVLLRLASRLQTLRWFAATRTACPQSLARETQQVFAPLANRLGIWQIKWELEDLSFRFLQPEEYRSVAHLLDETRIARELGVERARAQLEARLAEAGLRAQVLGRPKHLYSIWKKMQGKRLDFDRVLDLRALRVIVDDTAACYAALARVHECWPPLDGEFDDYIARPKPNGYQSLHTVVAGDGARPIEVQIRTRAMHEHAEHGVAAHWMYKEAGARGYAGVSAAGEFEERIAEARKAVLRELLAWERESTGTEQPAAGALFDERIYVFTPQATIIELAAGATPVDFAYALHTDLGHRCRGARVDGAMVPLNTPLTNGQTVEIVAARDGGPSMDWLNPELGYLRGARARTKVRAWFNAQAHDATVARGREGVERLLQREGRTAVKHEAMASQLGFASAEALFEAVGKDEFSLRQIEQWLRPAAPPAAQDEAPQLRPSRSGGGGVLVVGVGSLMTALARCCKPVPPDAIGGFVARGKGVAVHRRDCSNFRHMAERYPGREIEVRWDEAGSDRAPVYPMDVLIEAADRQGLLRDISDVFTKERLNVTAVNSLSHKDALGASARFVFTVEAENAGRLAGALRQVARLPGVRLARRK